MKPLFVYPGTFSPPTYGHVRIAEEAAVLFPKVIVLCSVNNEKNPWFTPEQTKAMWESYRLPRNIEVITLKEFIATRDLSHEIVMIRGIRGEEDLDQERKTLLYNLDTFGIRRFMYVVSDAEHRDISSTRVRKTAETVSLQILPGYVSPMVVSAVLEKALGLDNLFLVVGRPGSGKSTFIKEICKRDSRAEHIDTDRFSHELRSWLQAQFPDEDLLEVARTKEQLLTDTVAPKWFEKLEASLRGRDFGTRNLFVEVPYALKANKALYRMLGGKVLYIGCGDKTENAKRLEGRQTPEHKQFIETIPNRSESFEIAKRHRFQITGVDTSGSLEDLSREVSLFMATLSPEDGTS